MARAGQEAEALALTPAEELDAYVTDVFIEQAEDPFGYGELTFGLQSGAEGGAFCWMRVSQQQLEEFRFRIPLGWAEESSGQYLYIDGTRNTEGDFDIIEYVEREGEVGEAAAADCQLDQEVADALILFMGNTLSSEDYRLLDYPEEDLLEKFRKPLGRIQRIRGAVIAFATRIQLS